MIRHFVHLAFADHVTDADKAQILASLAALSGHIDGIEDFQHRRNVSVENALVRGFRDMFWFDFRDAAARDAYLADPEHKAVGARLVALLKSGPYGVFVCDIEV